MQHHHLVTNLDRSSICSAKVVTPVRYALPAIPKPRAEAHALKKGRIRPGLLSTYEQILLYYQHNTMSLE
jgi:hypothetical protein